MKRDKGDFEKKKKNSPPDIIQHVEHTYFGVFGEGATRHGTGTTRRILAQKHGNGAVGFTSKSYQPGYNTSTHSLTPCEHNIEAENNTQRCREVQRGAKRSVSYSRWQLPVAGHFAVTHGSGR